MIVILQYCDGFFFFFCHPSMWIGHRHTCVPSISNFYFIFWCGWFFKNMSLWNLLQYYSFCFMFFLFFGQEVCGILVPRSGIKLTSPALKGRVLTTGLSGKSPTCSVNQRAFGKKGSPYSGATVASTDCSPFFLWGFTSSSNPGFSRNWRKSIAEWWKMQGIQALAPLFLSWVA